MPVLVRVLTWFASHLITSFIIRFFIALNVSVITFYWVNDLVTQAKDQFQNAMYGIPSDILSFLQLYKIDQAMSVIFSAIFIAAYIKTAKIVLGRSN